MGKPELMLFPSELSRMYCDHLRTLEGSSTCWPAPVLARKTKTRFRSTFALLPPTAAGVLATLFVRYSPKRKMEL